jgi:hypothetical protein
MASARTSAASASATMRVTSAPAGTMSCTNPADWPAQRPESSQPAKTEHSDHRSR